MSVMYLLILLSLMLATGFVLAFIWAIRTGQYDDKFTPSVRMLFDDLPPQERSDSKPREKDKTATRNRAGTSADSEQKD